ncbi:hypothetical protein BpHYR1_051735 [Brachionus plicatilis]|uniref:Uncharacterized protein n=1 Tax=Brachionus plicatilis TaxID=10195 RepID=A0A3M7RE90_BRAPC|nr:hypothetical protein BpHYR1_051735 [Brachionus plicatilis]
MPVGQLPLDADLVGFEADHLELLRRVYVGEERAKVFDARLAEHVTALRRYAYHLYHVLAVRPQVVELELGVAETVVADHVVRLRFQAVLELVCRKLSKYSADLTSGFLNSQKCGSIFV